MIHQEQGSGASRARPVLAQLLKEIRAGDVLVVVRLDRLARSVSHLLEVIEGLEKKGAHFKSLQDPIDTSTPQGMFSLQVLGAVAQLERSLISERTKAGLRAAKARGKVLGNPGVREHRPETIRRLALAREKRYLDAAHCLGRSLDAHGEADAAGPPLGRRRSGSEWMGPELDGGTSSPCGSETGLAAHG